MKIANIFIGIIAISGFLFCFGFNKISTKSKSVLKNNEVFGNIEIRELTLAREECQKGMFSFCEGGFDDYFRNYPAFVQLNSDNFIHSYDGIVFLFPQPYIIDSLKKRGDKYYTPWELDKLFTQYNNEPIKFYTNKKYMKRVNKLIKENNLKVKFEGYFSYNLYEMKFKCIYGGNRTLLIPNTIGKKSESVMKEKNCRIYYIIDILHLTNVLKNGN
jgi:hypothetical protein